MTKTQTAKVDTLDSTFAKYFGPTEETNGTGIARRVSGGDVVDVIVDEAEHEAFLAKCDAEAKAQREATDAMITMEMWYEG